MPAIMPQLTFELSQCETALEFKSKIHQYLDDALSHIELTGTEVLVATYIEREKTASGLYKADRTVQESLYQGSVGLVLKVGPLAFRYDNRGYKWEGPSVKRDDWVLLRFADCLEVHVAGASCRLVDHENIRAILKSPDVITHEKPRSKPTVVSFK